MYAGQKELDKVNKLMKQAGFDMNIGQRVIVSAAVTGDGVQHKGWIADIYEFTNKTFIEVKFDSPAADGRPGCLVSNLGMIRKEAEA